LNTARSKQSLYRETTRAALLGLTVNLSLAIVKLLGGIVSRSFALISDGVHSVSDVFASVVVLIALRVARKPADREHPYGHTRAEAIAGSNVALLIIVSAVLLGWGIVTQIHVQHPTPPAWTLWIAGANVAIKEVLYRYKIRVGKRTGSSAVIANAWDHRSDALCSLAVLVGLAVVRIGGPAYGCADEAAALVVVAAIVWSGYALFRRSVHELMDQQADEAILKEVRRAAESVGGVQAVEKLFLRKTGLEYLVDIHIEVDGNLSVAEGHGIGHGVKDRLLGEFGILRDVLVHLEPHLDPNGPGPPS